MYICSEIENDVCLAWVEFSFLPALDIETSIRLGFAFLTLHATAYGLGLVAKTILGR